MEVNHKCMLGMAGQREEEGELSVTGKKVIATIHQHHSGETQSGVGLLLHLDWD